MPRVKIIGAGSIGNHLANAARSLGWGVTVCDVSRPALTRMKEEIYPQRYGSWDSEIELCDAANSPRGGFDFIFVGTPPEWHLPLTIDALDESPRAVMVEKPLCPPSLDRADELWQKAAGCSTKVFVGYDHVVSRGCRLTESLVSDGRIGDVVSIDVEFREHWEGIFKAHPWLNGAEDSYLGYVNRGGGASGEHSHALNLWQHLARFVGAGRVAEVVARLTYVSDGNANYDSQCFANLQTKGGLTGRVVQDVVTRPPVKRAIIQGKDGRIEFVIGYRPGVDAVIVYDAQGAKEVNEITKSRPDDFIEELRHIEHYSSADHTAESPIRLECGMDTALVLAAIHRSEAEKRRVAIDYTCGYVSDAILPGGVAEQVKSRRVA